MSRQYADRESYGPEFDDRLIKLVRANPAIYDVSHPHYRRNPVRVAIWDRISAELGASSRFLQTKWKNIRYNYLQEIKSIETGHPNANVRKRRFTEDLSFLQNTAQTYNVKKAAMYHYASYNSSDNDSNSYMYPDPEPEPEPEPSKSNNADQSAYEVIDLDQSDEGSEQDVFEAANNSQDECNDNKIMPELMVTLIKPDDLMPDVTLEHKSGNGERNSCMNKSSADSSYRSNNSSPIITPLVIMGNGNDEQDQEFTDKQLEQQQHQLSDGHHSAIMGNGNASTNGEITIEPIIKSKKRHMHISDFMEQPSKRKRVSVALPSLTPVNDPIELYCLSLVDCLRNMPRSERERVKFEFANILKDAKYKDQA